MSTDRLVALCGVLFVVLTFAGFMMMASGLPGGDTSTQSASEWIQDSGNRTGMLIGMFLMSAGALAFLGVVGGLLVRMERASAPALARELARLGGAGFCVVQILAAVGMGSGAMILASDFEPTSASPDAGLGRLAACGFVAWQLAAMPLAAVFIGSVSYSALANRVFPRWLGIVGWLCAGLLLLSVFFLPVVALPAWTICVAVVVLVRATESIPARVQPVPA